MMFKIQTITPAIMIFASNIIFTQAVGSITTEGKDINLETLIHQFLLLCGYDYICDISKFPQFRLPAPDQSYNVTRVCPNCYCDDECMSRGDCCPDIYFAVPLMSCVDTTLLNATRASKTVKPKRPSKIPSIKLEPKPPSYEIVNSCPSKIGSRERHLCEKSYTQKELLTRPPVASTTFPVSYTNKHCAICNGENDTLNWILDIDCILFADFNFLSTYQDIIDLAQKRRCRMRYSPMEFPVRPCNLTIPERDKLVTGSCNISGTWKHFDQSINLACKSTYYLKYHEYKNVFCYMCNPSLYRTDEVIGKCNVTGMWYPYDEGLERACIDHPTSQNTHPFKNVFCYLCNRIANDNETFYDVTTRIEERTYIMGRPRRYVYTYKIKTGKIRPEHLHYKYTKLNSMMEKVIEFKPQIIETPNDNSLVVRKDEIQLNVTNLVYKMFAVRPFDQFCVKSIVPLQFVVVVFEECSCKPDCLFLLNKLCCLDFSLTYPASCMDMYAVKPTNLRRSTKTLFLTDGCWNDAGHPVIRDQCVSKNQTDASSFIPLIEKFRNTYYKSFDCYLCNRKVEEIHPTDKLQNIARKSKYFLSDIDIICDYVLDFSHLVAFMDLVNFAKHINCSVGFDMKKGEKRFNPKYPSISCPRKRWTTNRCNVTGNWPIYDPDVAWACERAPSNILPTYKRYGNFYCYLCNPEGVVSDVISSCNVTGQWQYYNINHEKACHLFPRIYSYPKYKNIFCEICNSARVPKIVPDRISPRHDSKPGGKTPGLSLFQVTFRSLFSVAEYDETLAEGGGERCSKNQIYDYQKDECRNTTCFPGKVLNDSSCIPLLTITNNLRYTFSIEFTGQLPENQTNALAFLNAIENGINIHISKLFGTTEFKSDSFHLLSNFPCETKSAYVNTDTIKLYLHMTVHIEGYVPRSLTETSLLENASDMWNVSVESGVIGLVAKSSLVAAMTPSIIEKASFKETCFIQRFSNHTFVPWQTFRSVYVSKVLLCRQIELESDEYEINFAKMDLRIHSIGKTLPFNKFQRSSQRRVRVCIEDVEAISNQVKEDVDPSLPILTLACNTASMICLFLTFIVYLMNPTLRSIPGINNMCLVFALFFTQLSFQFGFMVPVESVYCEVIGIVLHLLWLSLFGCMNICSFHMFRVFSGVGKYHALHNKIKTLRNYITYSFGLPVVVVFVNTVFTLGFNKGQTTGYGVDKCFITNKISFIVTFLFPIIVVCLSNIVFFSITAHKIRITPRVESNQENHRHFGIYVKLFFITGVTWLATVIEAFFPLSVVSYLTTILNGCQGVFIFFSFIVNRRVYMLLKEGYENASRKFSRTSSAPATLTSSVALQSSPIGKGLTASSKDKGLNSSVTYKGYSSSFTDNDFNSASIDKDLNSSSTDKGLNTSATDI